MKSVDNRDEQFENIKNLSDRYFAAGNPVISIDTKKKECIGNLYRPEAVYTTAEIQTLDHDFNGGVRGIVVPHGIYDLKLNQGFINLGTSRDTSGFVTDSLYNWWNTQGQYNYPSAT